MAEYVVKEAVKQCLLDRGLYLTAVKNALEANTVADVVKVVRCKDCKHYGGVTYGFVCHKYSGDETKVCTNKDHYCSYGERNE